MLLVLMFISSSHYQTQEAKPLQQQTKVRKISEALEMFNKAAENETGMKNPKHETKSNMLLGPELCYRWLGLRVLDNHCQGHILLLLVQSIIITRDNGLLALIIF